MQRAICHTLPQQKKETLSKPQKAGQGEKKRFLSDFIKVAQQRLRRSIRRDGPAGKVDVGDAGAVRGAAAFKLTGKESVEEQLELFQNVACRQLAGKGKTSIVVQLARWEVVAQQIVQEKVVQRIVAQDVLGLLLNLSALVGRQQLRACLLYTSSSNSRRRNTAPAAPAARRAPTAGRKT